MAGPDSATMFAALRTDMQELVSSLTPPTVGVIKSKMYALGSLTLQEMEAIKDSNALVTTVLMKEQALPVKRLQIIKDFMAALNYAEEKAWAAKIEKAGLSSSGVLPSKNSLKSDEVDAPVALTSGSKQKKYDQPSGHRGRAVIIYLELYSNGSKVPGNKADGEALETFFVERRFRTDVIANERATKDRITARLNDVATEGHEDTSMFVCAIVSHGGTTGDNQDCVQTYNDNENLLIEEITAPFKKASGLAGKPKVFIINACRGSKVDKLHPLGGGEGCGNTNQPRTAIGRYVPFESDFLLFYSSVQGHVSSTTDGGSHFVETMLATLRKKSGLDAVAVFTSVIRKLTKRKPTDIAVDATLYPDFVQTPCIVSTLTKALHFGK